MITGIKRWYDTALDGTIQFFTTLYLPDYTVTYPADGGGLVEISRDDHWLGEVLVVPIVNWATPATTPPPPMASALPRPGT